jgi:ferredoxin-NADP reductase
MRSLRLVAKTQESIDVTSFEFVARDGGELTGFKAGQHLPIEVRIEGHALPLARTYSLSNAPGEGHYRISVKREPHGVVSRYLRQAKCWRHHQRAKAKRRLCAGA